MLTLIQLNNLRDIIPQARQCEIATLVPCELTIAQWALESGWGAHSPGNNCFGIKEYPGCLGRQLLFTREYFTPAQAQHWIAQKPGRTAKVSDATDRPDGTNLYWCEDWFATFPTIAHCFIKRAALFHSKSYEPFMLKYQSDRNFVSLVQNIAPIYATDPTYSKTILELASWPEVQAAIKAARS